MRLSFTESLSPGERLSKSIYNEQGQVLVREGLTLTQKIIDRLIKLNIPFVFIQDPRTEDICPSSSISRELRREAIQTIESVFKEIKTDKDVNRSFTIEKGAGRFSGVIRNILTEMQDKKELLTLLADVYTFDEYVFTHSFNVTLYSLAIGMEMNMKKKQLETLGLGAILHDVGKMLIPLEILQKSGKLTEEEFDEIQKHAEFGFYLLKSIFTIPLTVAHCAYQHHERLDGSGYPRGLKSEDIHFYGKIIAVADVFDAVTSNRVYRSAMLPHDGLEILYAGAGTKFDVSIIEAFRRAVAIYPIGMTVELNDGRKGIVSSQNQGIGDRPIVRILEEDGEQLTQPYEVNLSSNLTIMIKKCLDTPKTA